MAWSLSSALAKLDRAVRNTSTKKTTKPAKRTRKAAPATPKGTTKATKLYLTEQSDDRVYVRHGTKRIELEEPAGVEIKRGSTTMRVTLVFDYGWKVRIVGGGKLPPARVVATERDGDASAVVTLAPGATWKTVEG